jgi:uncharacterized protein (DUF305 family)
MIARPLVAACLMLGLAQAARAQDSMSQHDMHDHDMHDHASASKGKADTPSTKAFRAANAAMHKAMAIPYTGDADIDFVRGMIPHHQGAIDMAKVEIAHGKDPEIRKLAEDIVKAQEAEIAAMKAWLAKRGQ